MTHLAVRILAVVAADPSITTNGVCRKLKARKTDVIDELERMRRGRLLQFEHGKRGAKHWYPVESQGTSSHTLPDAQQLMAGKVGLERPA